MPIAVIEWDGRAAIAVFACPVCGATEPKIVELAIVDGAKLVRCRCGTRYWNNLQNFDYAESPEDWRGIHYYVEQGAAIDALIEPIGRLAQGRIRRCLEIGCGFGFSLDAAAVLFGWTVVGVDPSPLARAGKRMLGVDIRTIYADSTTDLGGPFDLVYGSEVIEHVSTPHEFLTICRAHLAPDGILILTTPDADALAPDLSPSILLPILSPSLHLVLFNADSLGLVARMAGFNSIQVVRRPYGLVLYASAAPLNIDLESKLDRGLYRRYLETAASRPNLPEILESGILYRLFKERVHEGRFIDAMAIFDALAKSCETRFGFSLAPPLSETILARVAEADFCAPYCLPGLMFHRGMALLIGHATPTGAAPWFDAALLAARALRQGYAKVLMDDGETGDIERLAPVHAIMALAQDDPAAAIARLREGAIADIDPVNVAALFMRLTDLGLLEEAAKLESAARQAEAWALDMRRGKIALLHHRRPVEAAKLFQRAFTGAAPNVSGGELWDIKYHEMLAWIMAADAMSAAAAAQEIIRSGDSVPEELRRSVDKLLAEHPIVGQTLNSLGRLRLRAIIREFWRRLIGFMN